MNTPLRSRAPLGRRRRFAVALLGLAVLTTVVAGCDRARVGQRCRGTGWAEDGGSWILRCTRGRYVRVLTKAQYVQILLANQPKPPAPAPTPAPTPTDPPAPTTTTIPPVPLVATQISSGFSHSCARISDGTLRCWGDGFFGQLGNGQFSNTVRAGAVSGVNDAAVVSAGGNFTCATRTGGTVWCWGDNKGGELGNGELGNIATPVQLTEITGATSLDTGYGHGCATFTSGPTTAGVVCWGANTTDQIGPGAASAAFNRPTVVPGLSGVREVTAGGGHSCALLADRTVRCWGNNVFGELGGTTATETSAALVTVTGLTDVASVAAGRRHTCARKLDSTVWCWGEGAQGKLGNGATANSTTPVQVTGLTDAVEIAAGEGHTCARRAGGSIACWGANASGQLGNDTTVGATTPVTVSGLGGVDALGVGDFHTCAHLAGDNTVRCWGSNATGQLGNLSNDNSALPVVVLT